MTTQLPDPKPDKLGTNATPDFWEVVIFLAACAFLFGVWLATEQMQ